MVSIETLATGKIIPRKFVRHAFLDQVDPLNSKHPLSGILASLIELHLLGFRRAAR